MSAPKTASHAEPVFTPSVEQGPDAAAMFLFDPPWWVFLGIAVVLGVVAGLTYRGYRRHGITDEIREEIVTNAFVVLVIAGVTRALVVFGSFGYAVDVLAGTTVGFVLGHGTIYGVKFATGEAEWRPPPFRDWWLEYYWVGIGALLLLASLFQISPRYSGGDLLYVPTVGLGGAVNAFGMAAFLVIHRTSADDPAVAVGEAPEHTERRNDNTMKTVVDDRNQIQIEASNDRDTFAVANKQPNGRWRAIGRAGFSRQTLGSFSTKGGAKRALKRWVRNNNRGDRSSDDDLFGGDSLFNNPF